MPSNHLILSSPSPPNPNPTQHQGLFQWVNSSHQVAKVLEFQLQHQSFQWTPRTDLLQDGLTWLKWLSSSSSSSTILLNFTFLIFFIFWFLFWLLFRTLDISSMKECLCWVLRINWENTNFRVRKPGLWLQRCHLPLDPWEVASLFWTLVFSSGKCNDHLGPSNSEMLQHERPGLTPANTRLWWMVSQQKDTSCTK